MQKKCLLIIPLTGLVLAGCAKMDLFETPLDCVKHEPPAQCQDNNLKVTLNLETMKANPPNICAKPGDTLTVNIVPKPDDGVGVAVVAKHYLDTWLLGSNASNLEEIKINVPDWVEPGDHDYGFVTTTGKCADPRVRVE